MKEHHQIFIYIKNLIKKDKRLLEINLEKKEFINPYWFEGKNQTMRDLRINEVKSFLKNNLGKILHLGEAPLFKKDLGIDFDETIGDLDIIKLEENNYDTVFMFEIAEHLFNPLFVLLNVRKTLKDGGVLYLSTPRRPFFLRNKNHHFHEYQDKSLENLLERAGFKITKTRLFRTRSLASGFRGLRPLLRVFFEKIILIEAYKIEIPTVKPIEY